MLHLSVVTLIAWGRGVILMLQKLGFLIGFAAVLIFGPAALVVMAVIWLLGLIFKD